MAAGAQTLQRQPAQPLEIRRPLAVTVNGANAGDWLLIERDGVLYAPQAAFTQWRVTPTQGAESIDVRGQVYFALSSVSGFQSRLDSSTQTLALTFLPSAFALTRLQEDLQRQVPVGTVLPSVFFNYDLNLAVNSPSGGATSRNLGALTELGWSTGAGVLTNTAVGRNLVANGTDNTTASWTRLETTFTKNFAEDRRTLRLGDSSTRSSLLGRTTYFGGVQFGSNFALSPSFISQPLPTVSGVSSAPSTVELYVNNVLRQVSEVPAGPFSLTRLPTFTGSGEARLVVRDLLGRETVATQAFFSNSQLLASGLSDWGVEAGALRRDLGTLSNSYGDRFASGTYKQGISNALTVEARAELTRHLRAASLGAIGVLPGQVLGRAAVMGSTSDSAGKGTQWLLGAEYARERFNTNLQIQHATHDFRQLGQDALILPIREQIAGSMSFSHTARSSVSAGIALVKRFDAPQVATLTLGYNTRIFERGNLQISLGRVSVSDVRQAYSLGFTAIFPFEKTVVTTTGIDRSNNQTSGYISASNITQNLGDLGWRVLAGHNASGNRAEAGLNYAAPFATLTGDVSQAPGQSAARAGISGTLLAADGSLFASQRINESFALVDVPGFAGLNIGLGGNTVATTNASGRAIVPRLAPYQSNTVRLDQNALPISAEIENIELYAAPAARSGVKLQFQVRSGRAALLRLVLADGEPVPAGATLKVAGSAQEYLVARRGEAYVTGLGNTSQITLVHKGQQCLIDITLPPEVINNITRLGPLICKGVAR